METQPRKTQPYLLDEDMEKYFRRLILKAHFKNDKNKKYEGYTSKGNRSWIPTNQGFDGRTHDKD